MRHSAKSRTIERLKIDRGYIAAGDEREEYQQKVEMYQNVEGMMGQPANEDVL